MRSNTESITTINKVKELISDKVNEFRRSEFVGPTISSELLIKGLKSHILRTFCNFDLYLAKV